MGVILDNRPSSPVLGSPSDPRLLAAADVNRTTQSRSRFVGADTVDPFPARFTPELGEEPQVLSLPDFVQQYFPEAQRGKDVPRGTTKAILTAYRNHIEGVRKAAMDRRGAENSQGFQREKLDLERMRLKAEQAARAIPKEKWNTLESLAVTRLAKLVEQNATPDQINKDPVVSRWAAMKRVTREFKGEDPLPTKAERLAELTELALAEYKRDGKYGNAAEALVLATNPLEFVKMMRGGDKTVADLKNQAASEAVKGMDDPKQRFEYLSGRNRSAIGAAGVHEEVFGVMGVGGITAKLDSMDGKGGVSAFTAALKKYEQMQGFADPQTLESVEQLLRRSQPSVMAILQAGPKTKDANGKTVGTGELTEEEVEALLKFVIPEEEQQRLMQTQE